MLALGLLYFPFSSLLRWKVRLLICDLLSFLIWIFNVINFPLRIALVMPTDFYKLGILIYFSYNSLKLCVWLMDVEFIILREHTLYYFTSLKVVEGLFYISGYGVSLWVLQVCLKECIFCFCLGGMFYNFQLDLIGWWRCSVLLYHCWFSVWWFLSVTEKVASKSPTIVIDLFISPLSSIFASYILEVCCLPHTHLGLLCLLGGLSLLSQCNVCGNILCSKVYFV